MIFLFTTYVFQKFDRSKRPVFGVKSIRSELQPSGARGYVRIIYNFISEFIRFTSRASDYYY